MNHEKPITEGLFTSLDPSQTQLIGSVCTDCGNYAFPRAHGCSRCCGTSVKPVDLKRCGTLWSWTTQSFMPPSPPYRGPDDSWETFKPFLLGMIELPGQCRVLGRLLLEKPEDIEIGMAMELTLFPYREDKDDNMLLSYAFKPANN